MLQPPSEVYSTNWANYLDLVYDVPFWEAELAIGRAQAGGRNDTHYSRSIITSSLLVVY